VFFYQKASTISKERLVNAMITLVDRNQSTFTNDQGIFQLKTASGKLVYAVSYPGFETFYDTIEDEKRNYFICILDFLFFNLGFSQILYEAIKNT
jgi:hypothetical protein